MQFYFMFPLLLLLSLLFTPQHLPHMHAHGGLVGLSLVKDEGKQATRTDEEESEETGKPGTPRKSLMYPSSSGFVISVHLTC